MRCYNAVMPMLRKSLPIIGLLIGGAVGALLSIIPDPLSLFLWHLLRRPWYLDPWSIIVDTVDWCVDWPRTWRWAAKIAVARPATVFPLTKSKRHHYPFRLSLDATPITLEVSTGSPGERDG